MWDLAGKDEFQELRVSYLRGSSGYLLVADGTRPNTLDVAINLQQEVEAALGKVPFIFIINKCDLVDEWRIDASDIDALRSKGWEIILTSAKQGNAVEEAFLALGTKMLEN